MIMRKLIILILAVLLPAMAYAADTVSDSPPLTKKEQRRTLRGYKGFVELGMGATHHDFDYIGDNNTDDKPRGFGMELLTIHGYQFNNFFFLGGGVGINECTETNVMIPVFADFRVNMLNKRISPVFDTKWGYAIGDHHGMYFSFNLGLRFSLKKKPKSAVYAIGEFSWIGDTEVGGVWDMKLVRTSPSYECTRYLFKIGYEF